MFREPAILILAVLTIGAQHVSAQEQSEPGVLLRNASSTVIYNYAAESGQGRSGTGGGAEANEVDMPAVSSRLTKYRATILIENVGSKQIFAVTWVHSEQDRSKSSWRRLRIQQVILPGQTVELHKAVLSESSIGDRAMIDKIEYVDGTTWQRRAGSRDHEAVSGPPRVLLFPNKQGPPDRTYFNFEFGVRGDLELGQFVDLYFGHYIPNGDSSWFQVESGENSYSQIKDLGELAWSEVTTVPILPASTEPFLRMTFRYNAGRLAQMTPANVLVKAIVGHLYVVHSKALKIDRYAMFRVEAINAQGVCTISWKLVPSPESR